MTDIDPKAALSLVFGVLLVLAIVAGHLAERDEARRSGR